MKVTKEVVGARVTEDEKDRIRRAAEAEGRSISRFLRVLARERAAEILNGSPADAAN